MRVKGKVCPLFLSPADYNVQCTMKSGVRPELDKSRRETLQDVSRARWDNVCTQSTNADAGEREERKRMMQERRMKRILNGKIEESTSGERRGPTSSHDEEDEDGRGEEKGELVQVVTQKDRTSNFTPGITVATLIHNSHSRYFMSPTVN